MFIKCLIYILLSIITFSMVYALVDRICKCVECCKSAKLIQSVATKEKDETDSEKEIDKYII